MACNNTYSSRDAASSTGSTRSESERVKSQAERILHENFKELRDKTLDQIRQELRESPQHRQWFGKLGELHATVSWAAPFLGVQQIGFHQAYHGIDHVGLAPNGNLAVFESKFFDEKPDPRVALKQMSWDHLNSRFNRMLTPGRKEAQGANPAIAIQAGMRDIDRYIVVGSYSDRKAWLYEVVDGPDGSPQVGKCMKESHLRTFMGLMYDIEFGDSE